MLSRQTLRQLASVGYELLDGIRQAHDRPIHTNRLLARRRFLTVLCARMIRRNDVPASFEESLGNLDQWLSNNGRKWTFFEPTAAGCAKSQALWERWADDDLKSVWKKPESLGWIYQYFLEPDLLMFRSPRAPKIRAKHLALRTQQFTPSWIADFLAENTIGRWWVRMHPDSRLNQSLEWIVPEESIDESRELKPVRELKILDPACGTMHLGLSAIKLLETMYREELENAGKTGWPLKASVDHPSEIYSAILKNNLYGIDIDPVAVELATITLLLKTSRHDQPPHLLCMDTLKRNGKSILAKNNFPDRFDVVLLNPPYLDKRDYNPSMKAFMAKYYPQSGRNLYTAFLERSIDFLADGGCLGAVTPQTFMYIRSFKDLRQMLLDRTAIETLVHTGLNTFDDAVVDCAFYVLRCEDRDTVRRNAAGRYFQLTTLGSPEEKSECLTKMLGKLRNNPGKNPKNTYQSCPSDFSALPDTPWVYWISPEIRRLFSRLPSLGRTAELRQGLATTHNDRFLRYWWEIPSEQVSWNCRNLAEAKASGKRWFPYMKGGEYLKWYGNREFLVNWEDDGREIKTEIVRRYPYLKGNWQWVAKNTEFYFREGITYSYLTSGKFSARYSPQGSIFDVAGSSIFCHDPYLVLAVLNSRWCRFALGLINPTVNFQVGDLQRLPIPDKPCPPDLHRLVIEAIELAKSIEAFEETSPDFLTPPPWPDGCDFIARQIDRLTEIQDQIDQKIYRLYDLNSADQRSIEQQTVPDKITNDLTPERLAHRWISYALGIAVGRYHPETDSAHRLLWPVEPSDHDGFAARVTNALETLVGNQNARKIIGTVSPTGNLHEYLSKDFFIRHFREFRRRPIYWLLQHKKQLFALHYMNLDQQAIEHNFSEWKLDRRRDKNNDCFSLDDGIAWNLERFRKHIALPSWQRAIDHRKSRR